MKTRVFLTILSVFVVLLFLKMFLLFFEISIILFALPCMSNVKWLLIQRVYFTAPIVNSVEKNGL